MTADEEWTSFTLPAFPADAPTIVHSDGKGAELGLTGADTADAWFFVRDYYRNGKLLRRVITTMEGAIL